MTVADLASTIRRQTRNFAFLIMGFVLAFQGACSSNSSLQNPNATRSSAESETKQPSIHLYRVQVNGKYGYIDRAGHVVVPPQYSRAEDFSEGLAAVSFDSSYPGKWGYIDTNGRFVIAPRFQEAHSFSDGIARVNPEVLIEHAVFIDKTGREAFRREQFVGPGIKSVLFDHDFSEGLAALLVEKPEGRPSYGYINVNGQIAVGPQFERAFEFREGVAEIEAGESEDHVRGLIDKTGRMVSRNLHDLCPFLFAGEIVFSEGLAPVKTSCFADSWGYVDHSGQFVIKPQFASATIFSQDLAIVGYEIRGAPDPSAASYLDGLQVFGDGGLNYLPTKRLPHGGLSQRSCAGSANARI